MFWELVQIAALLYVGGQLYDWSAKKIRLMRVGRTAVPLALELTAHANQSTSSEELRAQVITAFTGRRLIFVAEDKQHSHVMVVSWTHRLGHGYTLDVAIKRRSDDGVIYRHLKTNTYGLLSLLREIADDVSLTIREDLREETQIVPQGTPA